MLAAPLALCLLKVPIPSHPVGPQDLCYKGHDVTIPPRSTKGSLMAMRSSNRLDESTLTKGQRRKLNALRKSVGDEIGEQAFAAWLSSQSQVAGAAADENSALIVDTLWPLVQEGTLSIPRGGYLLRRGRGRIIVEPARS